MKVLWLLFSFQGRIGRIAYARAAFGALFASFAAMIALAYSADVAQLSALEQLNAMIAVMQSRQEPMFVIVVVSWWVGFALATKRQHDVGRSGRINLYLILGFAAAAGLAAFGLANYSEPLTWVGAGSLAGLSLYWLWIVFEMFVCEGHCCRNRYGAPPSAAPKKQAGRPVPDDPACRLSKAANHGRDPNREASPPPTPTLAASEEIRSSPPLLRPVRRQHRLQDLIGDILQRAGGVR